MELADSSEINNRSPLGIDLNEIPSYSSPPSIALPEPGPDPDEPDTDPLELDSFDVVRSFHENQDPASGVAAGLPEEEKLPTCGTCGKPELGAHVVVCDGCERGFHIACAGMHGKQVSNLVDWICGDCVSGGVKSKRWPLGVKSKRILDINASPPSDCDGDGDSSEERLTLRKPSIGDNSSSGNAFGAPVTYSNHLYAGNRFGSFGFKKGSGLMMKAFRVGFGDIIHRTKTTDRSLEEIDLDFPVGKLKKSNNTAIILPSRSPNEILLHGLRDFVSERHGVLEEGWHVELKHYTNSIEVYAVYCSPDGKTFGSMSEVACYLGLPLNCNSMDADAKSDGSPSIQELLHVPKKRKAKRLSLANGLAENKQSLLNGCHKGLMANGQSVEIGGTKSGKLTDAGAGEDDNAKSPASDDGLPVQFEDFFVISLGKIDARPSYHEHQLIWPVSYKSCWHDKVTGSLFVCEVLDGGDSGPVFKVRRFSCSGLPIPDASTVLYRKNFVLDTGQNMKDYSNTSCYNTDCDNEFNVEMILTDASPPTEGDILSCLKLSSNENNGVKISDGLLDCSYPSSSQNLSACNLGFADEIGEMSAEETSSSLAWRILCQKLIGAYSKLCTKKGHLKLYCKHVDNDIGSLAWDTKDKKTIDSLSPISKFCSPSISADIPLEYQGEADSLAATLSKWLDQDRFGFDAHFVQEILEQLPGLDACSKYEPLINRINYSVSLTVGNGFLVVKRKRGAEFDDSQKSKRARLGEAACETDDHDPPLGRVLCSKLPPVLVGDIYQVWELLWRFRSLLGLNGPLLLGKLEDELISPWFDGANLAEDLERKFHENQVTGFDKVDGMSRPVSYSYQESCMINGDSSHVLMKMENKATKDLAEASSSVAHCRCSGVALTEVHSSLLSVLIGELQLKVAAIVDPSFDSGDLKSKRGRRKDVDSLTAARRSKLTTLPFNELTWPELARRYILAVLSMDGNLESAESTARESVKVFRCLQGDGGVLCGSLAGVAGMEADALLLAEATKQIYGSLSIEKDVLTIEEEATDPCGSSENNCVNDCIIPEWAKVLEPVKRLPTNVGTRIRNCVNDALTKDPPEWAKKRLEHSISKGVYKGNASGPTKKAVLSVLDDVQKEGLLQKSEQKNKRKISVPVSDIIMKQCRIVLHQVAAADDAKVFCTLLGRNIITSCDHLEEGLLGSPAMVSRPLDFRTIDLRLAVGAYGGSRQSFLEDIQELWNNVRTAFRDQPHVVELADTLSQNFDLSYEKEVVPLVEKFEQYAKLDYLSAETMKELDNILASTNEIPKAPWDEGVCKVCGVDRDDDSVLLCDSCDAEYHTYCLNPPLARIPEGNWYCPSCVGVAKVQEAPSCSQVIGGTHSKKHQGEFTNVYLQTLMHLAALLEQKDYWDFGIDERTFLLKFLCDEFLNSPIVHQYLEQCMETTAELQQKLRLLSVEWRNLKSKEELAAKAAKMGTGGKGETKDGLGSVITKQGRPIGKPSNLSDKSSHFCAGSDGVPGVIGNHKSTETYAPDKHSSVVNSEKKLNCESQNINSVDTEGHVKDLCGVPNGTNRDNDKSSQPSKLPLSNELQHVTDHVDEICGQSKLEEYIGRESSTFLPPSDHLESSISLEMDSRVLDNVSTVAVNESQACHSELSKVKEDIFHLQSLINSIELKILKQSIRREFLGSDSSGRLYWASATHGGLPVVIVDGSLMLQQRKSSAHGGSAIWHSSSSSSSSWINTSFTLEGSRARVPFLLYPNDTIAMCSPWVTYETEADIEALIGWLGKNNQKERDLKESILQLLKLRSQGTQQIEDTLQDECHAASAIITDNDATSSSDCLLTKAALFLEKKYGTFTQLQTADMLKKGGKQARGFIEEKMYRCYCLEPIWPSRQHCHSCHRTSNDVEFEGHDDGRCNLVPSSHEKNDETNDSTNGKEDVKSDVSQKEYISEKDKVQTAKSGCCEIGSRLTKFENEGTEWPYDFAQICMKFVTKDSNKKLVEDIGLIGSNGIPLFVTSISPYLSDSTLMLSCAKKNTGVQFDNFNAVDQQAVLEENRNQSTVNSPIKAAANETSKLFETFKPSVEPLRQKGEKSFGKRSSEMRSISRCLIPQSSLRQLTGKVSPILRKLKISLLDMEATLPSEALRPSKRCLRRRWAWRAYVKSAGSIYQMVQATIILEEMIKTEHLRNEWWYWSSLSAAAKTSTVSSLALRIFSLDSSIIYEKTLCDSDPSENFNPDSSSNQKQLAGLDSLDKCKVTRKSNKKRKEPEG
ncbi:methyl-CpG-binding domain-containing protein 9 [Euphorbia lathyris]|uniref:methyl-CpG-binding domain-containing protein 9 n=1 Tax=Euphorbia lathyris TaxID=212925 RepID=UPI003313A382